MEPRRVVLAVILMALVLIVTPLIFKSPPTGLPNGTPVTDTLRTDARGDSALTTTTGSGEVARPSPNVAGNGTTAVASLPVASAASAAGVAPAPVATPIDTAVVTTKSAVFRTTNRGGSLIGVQLTKYPTLRNRGRDKGEPVELAGAGDRLLSFRLVVPGDTIRLDTVQFQSQQREASGVTTVTYTGTVRANPVSIEYSFLPDSYRVNIAAHASGVPPNSFLLVDLPPGFRSSEADTVEDRTHLAYAYKPDKKSAEGVTFGSLDPGERRIESEPMNWVVAKNKYFLLGVLAPAGRPNFIELDVTGGVRTAKAATRAQATAILPLTNGDGALEVYAGPQEFKRLVAVGREFETSNPYGGWLQGIVQPFATIVIRMLLWMKQSLGLGYGWILVLFGVAVRVVLWPLNQRAMRSSMQMQRIQPEMQALQAKHKGEPQRLQAEMMKLYKEHGMSPFSSLSGCLPMLIPLPIFFALFFVFQNTIEFRGVSFLWLPDISIKDPFYVLPILVAITAMLLSYIGMRGMKSNEQQKMMMYMMPAMMLFIFLNMAGGLNLYYLIQNLASLPQQWLISQERGRQTPLVRG